MQPSINFSILGPAVVQIIRNNKDLFLGLLHAAQQQQNPRNLLKIIY